MAALELIVTQWDVNNPSTTDVGAMYNELIVTQWDVNSRPYQ